MKQINILCYGDSNTWGYVPQADHSATKARYTRDERWPGVLQKILGENFHIVEEGLNSRTTNIDYALPPERNGKTYLAPCLYSHAPLDLVILALGGNDTKTYFNRSAEQIKEGLAELVDIIQTSSYGTDMIHAPKVMILTCALPFSFIEDYVDEQGEKFLAGSVEKSQALIGLYEQLAKEKNCYFLDLSKDVIPSTIDGVHYDEQAHKKCAEMVGEKLKHVFMKKE
jgi:lysophospholipase L1-like esterase